MGLLEPLVWNKTTGHLVSGHQRLAQLDSLQRSENYYEWKIIAIGPIRTIFELRYKPWQMGDEKIGEVKRISLDAGANFNHIESRFDGNVKNTMLAVGIVKCKRGGKATYAKNKNWLVYWENPHPKFGIIGCGVILPKGAVRGKSAEDGENNFLLGKLNGKNSISYYAGAGWVSMYGLYFGLI